MFFSTSKWINAVSKFLICTKLQNTSEDTALCTMAVFSITITQPHCKPIVFPDLPSWPPPPTSYQVLVVLDLWKTPQEGWMPPLIATLSHWLNNLYLLWLPGTHCPRQCLYWLRLMGGGAERSTKLAAAPPPLSPPQTAPCLCASAPHAGSWLTPAPTGEKLGLWDIQKA